MKRCECSEYYESNSGYIGSFGVPSIPGQPKQICGKCGGYRPFKTSAHDPSPVVDTCDLGHKFAKLPDHPMKDGRPRCPHCMAEGLDACYLLFR